MYLELEDIELSEPGAADPLFKYTTHLFKKSIFKTYG